MEDFGQLTVVGLCHRFAVERVEKCLPHACVLPQRPVVVSPYGHAAAELTAEQDDVGVVLVAFIFDGGDAAGHVDLAVFKRGEGGGATQTDAEDDAIEVGAAGIVVLVGIQDIELVRLEFAHREGAGTNGVADAILAAVQVGEGDALKQMLRPDVEGGHIAENAAARPHEVELYGVVVESLDAADLVGLAVFKGLGADQLIQPRSAAVRCTRIGMEEHLERVLDIFGRQLLAIVETDIIAQVESIGEAVIGDFPARRQVGMDRDGIGVAVYQLAPEIVIASAEGEPVSPCHGAGGAGDNNLAALLGR